METKPADTGADQSREGNNVITLITDRGNQYPITRYRMIELINEHATPMITETNTHGDIEHKFPNGGSIIESREGN